MAKITRTRIYLFLASGSSVTHFNADDRFVRRSIDMMQIVVVASLLLRTLTLTHCKDVIAAGHNRQFLLGRRTLMDEGELVYFPRSS
jgi:hypothetical protein